MSPPIEEILADYDWQPELVERISYRDVATPIKIHPPNPAWPQIFLGIKDRIIAALGETALSVNHVGSTSVPGLSAKDIIDIDLVVQDSTDESTYVKALESAGFNFLLRERHWHEHRFFYTSAPQAINLHVWGPDCAEVARHQIFRQRLLNHPGDLAMYAECKDVAARETREDGGDMNEYTARKTEVIKKILRNAFVELGYISGNEGY
ncbi:UPF0157-domain-containing protein [Aureobasidium pullulans]|uniref:UPF0157-domain-containing protein n=1 Tax=Aureobasidium pullulans TaxID=5580 RepID=A0A4V4IUS1_AURPU|nr:UPF0157-domain-containing protein [Aureobasidium pullulans]